MLKSINFMRLTVIITILIFIAVVAYFVTFAQDEGGFEDSGVIVNSLVFIVKWIFILIAFPVFLYQKLFGFPYGIAYFVIIIIDCFLYGVIIEMIIIKYRQFKIKKST